MANKVGKRTLKATSTTKIDGKLQPQAIELEQAVLGALMIDNESLSDTIDSLQAEYFYKAEHQKIFEAIVSLFNHTQPVDILTVSEELKRMQELEFVGGLAYISELTNNVASSSNTEFHARIIAEKFIKRSLISISNNIIGDAFNDSVDIFDLLNTAEEKLFTVTEGTLRKSYEKMSSLIKGALENIEILRSKEDGLSGVPSGFTNLDRVTSGWQKSDLVIVASRPGMGKTAFALTMARNIAIDHNVPIGFFSLEMSAEQIATRVLAQESKISSDKMRKAELTKDDFKKIASASAKLEDLNLIIDDNPFLTIPTLRARARRLKRLHNINMIIIDYLQLMSGTGNTKNEGRVQEISQITRGLKAIAKELNIPIIALSQLSRQVEQRDDKRPQLADLRESGTIEQDSDVVMFIFRESYYLERMEPIKNPSESEDGYNERHERWRELCEKNYNTAEIIIAKHMGQSGPLKHISIQILQDLVT